MQIFDDFSKAVGINFPPLIPLFYLRGWNRNVACDFSIKM